MKSDHASRVTPLGSWCRFCSMILPGYPGGIDDVLLAHGKNVDAQGVLSVESGEAAAVDEAVIDGGDVTQQQARAVGPGAQYDVLEILLHIGLAEGSQHDVAVACLYRARGNIQGGGGDNIGDIPQRQVILAQ